MLAPLLLFSCGLAPRLALTQKFAPRLQPRRWTAPRLAAEQAETADAELTAAAPASAASAVPILPCGDALDKRIAALSGPAIANFLILPLVGATDLYFVGQMRQPLALAGQAAGNQVFSSSFWIASFLPSVLTPMVAKAAAKNDMDKVRSLSPTV